MLTVDSSLTMSDRPSHLTPNKSSSGPFRDRANVSHTDAEIHHLIQHAMAATNNAMVITDSHQHDNPIIYVNRAFERLSGYAEDEVIGYNCRFMQYRSNGMRDADQEGVKTLRRFIRHKEPTRVIMRNYRKSGEQFWNELYVAPFADPETGEARYFVSVQRDVTKRIEHNRSYEREVATRIQALKEERDALERAKTSLVRTMNREVRDTLTAILGLADLIQEERTAVPSNEYTARIRAEGQRLMDTLSSLQERIGMHDGALEYAAVAPIVRDAVEHMQVSTPRDDLPLTMTVDPDAQEAVAHLNASRTATVLQTLITTIMLRDSAQGCTVRVYTTTHSSQPYVAVDVKGEHVEISEALHPLLFERSTYDTAGKGPEYDGSGIDLSLTRELVESMGGTLSMESAPDDGTTFTIAFPHVPEQEPSGASVPSSERERGSVLIVEDNEDIIFLIQDMLEDTADLSTASSVSDALQKAQDTDIDLFLVDINLGTGRSGTDLLNDLRAMDRYENTPIIAVTAIAMRGDRERFLDQGFDDYLAKPFTPDTLTSMVNRHLS